jgi:hypothetical protein
VEIFFSLETSLLGSATASLLKKGKPAWVPQSTVREKARIYGRNPDIEPRKNMAPNILENILIQKMQINSFWIIGIFYLYAKKL